MRHYMHLPENNLDKIFYIKPSDFDITTKKSDLRYCLGATLYLPATKYIAPYLLEKRYTHLTSYAMCFENLIHEKSISIAEKTVLNTLRTLKMAEDENRIQILKSAIKDGLDSGISKDFNATENLKKLKAKKSQND